MIIQHVLKQSINQANKLGKTIKRREKGTPIFFYQVSKLKENT